jgi:cardiolipin synthase A/B
VIGGANWDMPSFRLNFELNMEVYHADIVQHVDGLMAARRGTLVTAAALDGLPLPVKLIDRGARLMLPYL